MNVVDEAFKRILKIARTLSSVITIAYLVCGIIILSLNVEIEDYIYLIF